MIVIKDESSRPIKAWVNTKFTPLAPGASTGLTEPNIEDTALKQLKNIARLPFIHANGVAVMPDVHAGIGATVGSVIATTSAIIPAAVGVDIGCGMNAVRTSLKASDLPDSLTALRHSIERGVPLGAGGKHTKDSKIEELAVGIPRLPSLRFSDCLQSLAPNSIRNIASQLGTLGSGNHFIEICLDENQNVWVMLHSGSRGIGNKIGRHFIELAKRDMEKYYVNLPDKDLAYLPEGTVNFEAYCEAVTWAQAYALRNRAAMMTEVLRNLQHEVAPFAVTHEAINCHHNYISRENHFGQNLWITRKGAIRAREGDLGIIPGSMGQRSYIVRGKGNAESYCSCSHGAGRVMSRTEAGKRFSVEDLIAQTEGVECRKDAAVLDEIPAAYKNIDEVMANQTDLVEVVHTLKQVLCVKGA